MTKEPWVLIAGGFHSNGGMDKANLALASYLVAEGHQIHLVAHSVADHLLDNPLVNVHLVHRPLGSFALAEPALEICGRKTAKRVKEQSPAARVLTNGGNCRWGDVSWAHCVHQAWPCSDKGAPTWFRAKNRAIKSLAIRAERRVFRSAQTVIANSQKTRQALIDLSGVDAQRVHVVYLGAEAECIAPSDAERKSAREKLGRDKECPMVAFVGALSLDNNKGFDTLWTAWRSLCQARYWDAHLIVAGGGNGLSQWKSRTSAAGLAARVTYLGFTDRVNDLLAAADLLVSPVRYEAYGLNVQEAVCRGVPAIVSSSAGIAERFPEDLNSMLLGDPEDVSGLVERLLMWRSNIDLWKCRFRAFGRALRSNTWDDMALRIVSLARHERECGSHNSSGSLIYQ